jgi:hypothetical protein
VEQLESLVVTANPDEMNSESESRLIEDRSHQRVSSLWVYSNCRTLLSLVEVAILIEMPPPSELVRHCSV